MGQASERKKYINELIYLQTQERLSINIASTKKKIKSNLVLSAALKLRPVDKEPRILP